QGTQINAEPAGVGATFSPGQVLAPAAEMLKQFSDVMLVVCVAFGIEKLLIAIGSQPAVASVLTVIALGWLWAAAREQRPPAWLSKLFLLLLMVQFAVPVTVLGSDQIFQRFLDKDYQEAQQAMTPLAARTSSAPNPVPLDVEKPGFLEAAKSWFKKKTEGPVGEYQALKTTVEMATQHIVRLLAIFVLQTILIPLLLLWALYGLTRALLRWPGNTPVPSTRPLP
ncbi:MAG: hypothetical protein ABJA94_11230, partial [Rhodoglobus sp.]